MQLYIQPPPPQSSCMCISDRSTSPILQAFCGKNALSSTLCYRLKHAHNYGLLRHGTCIWHLATIESYLSYLIAKNMSITMTGSGDYYSTPELTILAGTIRRENDSETRQEVIRENI